MKTFTRRVATIAALILIILITSMLANPPSPSTADADGGTVLWKEICPWRAAVEISQDGRNVVVQCSQYR